MNLWLAILAAGIATFVIRFSFIGMADRMEPPHWFRATLRFVPISALTALIWPDLLMVQGVLTPTEPRMLAGLFAAVIAWYTRNVLWTIAGGMLCLWTIQSVRP